MNLLEQVDIYCERTDATLFGEPLNAISNVAFFIAAFCAFKLYKKEAQRDTMLLVLICLMFCVAIGSSLFHVFANQLTQLADTIPIIGFVLLSLWLIVRRLLAYNILQTIVMFSVLFAMAAATPYSPWQLNGSIAYVPCLVMLIYIGALLKKRRHPAAHSILIAAIAFIGSLTFRSIDMDICSAFPHGTHILWHMLNGFVLYFITKSLVVNKYP
jgi:membrane-associated HD superfamily phosphohydrolase